ncbi:membrane protein [Clostridium acetobutylicum]|nr:membrane protein [Clostridium acetobutylicum]
MLILVSYCIMYSIEFIYYMVIVIRVVVIMRKKNEQRKFKRTDYKCNVDSFILNGELQLEQVEILDISEAGARIHVPKRINVGDRVTFNFKMGSLNITCNATIVWGTSSLTDGFINGCKFDILATDKRLLKLFIDSLYNKNFISLYRDKQTYIVPNMYLTLNLSNTDIYRVFQYATYQLGTLKKTDNKYDLAIHDNLVNRLNDYLNNNLDCFKVSIYESTQFKRIIDFCILSLQYNDENISALRLEDLDMSDFDSDRAEKYKSDFEKLPEDIRLEAITEISKSLSAKGLKVLN